MPDRLPSLVLLVACWVPPAWFYINGDHMPPYIPGATHDPTYASPEAVERLFVVTSTLVLPVSALACDVAFRGRRRLLQKSSELPDVTSRTVHS